ncbi:hypothetical protein [Enemella dayhoffiae]|nr:hypothetical protein [Enemella dayhoffiae]
MSKGTVVLKGFVRDLLDDLLRQLDRVATRNMTSWRESSASRSVAIC